MDLMITTEGTYLTVVLPEEVDHPVADYIRQETDRIMGKIYIRTIIFDFRKTIFMDSSGVGMIMGRYRALGMRKGTIQAVNVGKNIERILRLSGTYKYMHICAEIAQKEE